MELRKPRWLSLLFLIGLLANSFVFLLVNFSINHARLLFAERNPDYIKVHIATVSQSISDPVVGEPFAFWMSFSAVLLAVAILPIVWLHLRAAATIKSRAPWLYRVTIALSIFGYGSQIVAAVGIITLSQYRFPDYNSQHMNGSYMFFTAQALAIIASSFVCYALAIGAGFQAILKSSASLVYSMNALRWKLAIFSFVSVIVYVVLFVIKDWPFAVGNKLIYNTYVYLEPIVIGSFLVYLLSFNVDLWGASFRKRRSGRDR